MIPDVYPSITVDDRLDEIIEDISIDLPKLVSVMRERGFSDEQITKTKISIHNKAPCTNVKLESGRKMVPTGSYDALMREIGLYPRLKIIEGLAGMDVANEHDDGYDVLSQKLSSEFSMALVHEVEHHAMEVLEGGRPLSRAEYVAIGKSALKLLVSFPVLLSVTNRAWDVSAQMINYDPGNTASSIAAIGSVALAGAGAFKFAIPREMTYSQYRDSAAEVRTYETEQTAPTDLVMIRPKTSARADQLVKATF